MANANIPSFNELYADALEQMHNQDIGSEVLDPNIVVLATNNPTVVRRASSNAHVNHFSEEIVAERDLTAELSPETELARAHARDLENTVQHLTRSARRKVFAGIFAAGTGIAALALVGTAGIKYDINRSLPTVTKPVIGDPMLEGTNLVYDSSIMPGDVGEDIPVIGPVLAHIPGVPDFAPLEVETYNIDKGGRMVKTGTKIEDESISGELVVALPLIAGGAYAGGMAGSLRFRGNARRKARKIARKTGFSL